MEKYNPGIGVCAGSWMLKWNMLDMHIHNNKLLNLQPEDNVNVFINFECVLKNLSMQRNLASNISYYKQDVVIELEAAIINLVAHYKSYFKKEKCNPKVYLYYTSISDEYEQEMKIFNKYYRSYYRNRYGNNPQFRSMGNLLTSIIIPEVKLILQYVPDCYFIESKSFDGSIIPKVISSFSDSKNVIISGDIFDTLYMYDPLFTVIYIKRRFQYFNVMSDIESTIQSIIKNESPFDLNIFTSELYFRLLLSIKGSKIRNIRSAKGFGYSKFLTLLQNGIRDNVILQDLKSLDSIIKLFPEKYQEEIKEAFQCTDINTQSRLINQADIDDIKSQMIDKIDIESVEALNNKRFFNYPINITSLI